MNSDVMNSRRNFIRNTLGTAGGFFAIPTLAEVCTPTPKQTSGPFYPVEKIVDNSINDLTQIAGHNLTAKGEVFYLNGQVVDKNCRPIGGALVEIWQASESGRYNHPSDTSGLELDPDFQNWGEFITEADGTFAFKTIAPGHYPANATWTRPPHIHVKVSRLGFKDLVTQLYFAPESFEASKAKLVEKLNKDDLILQSIPNKHSVIVSYKPVPQETEVGALLAYSENSGATTLVKVGQIKARIGEKLGTAELTLA